MAALAEAYLRAPYLDDGTPVSLAATTTDPEVSRAEVQRVATEVATPATASDLTLVVDGTPVTVTPAAIAAALTFAPDGKGSLAPRLDGAALHTAIGAPLTAVETPATDATLPDPVRHAHRRTVPVWSRGAARHACRLPCCPR